MADVKADRKTIAVGIGSVALLGGGLFVAVPAVAGPSPAPSASPSATKTDKPRKPGQHRHRAATRGVHGEATVRRGNAFRVVTWQKGTVTARADGKLTVRSADGASWQWTTNDRTRVRVKGEKSKLDALRNGATVVVSGPRSGATRTANLVRVPKS
ncbi:hypothetical protein [Actinomadura flavalba]|uniref:hypothetical protein n=1 Tax=Actinomadura flavalba TaxID=1120938 RepID=UPI0003689736|nr:hypothetical protein [Actinomadura flavalba]